MHITSHAMKRARERGVASLALLERSPGEPGTVAYLLGDVTFVAIAIDGSVETIYARRTEQDMRAEFFGARRVVDLRKGA